MHNKKVKEILLEFYNVVSIADKIVIGNDNSEEMRMRYKEERIKLSKVLASLPKK